MPYAPQDPVFDPSSANRSNSRSAPVSAPIPHHNSVDAAADSLWARRDHAYRGGRPSGVPPLPSPEEALALAAHAASFPGAVPEPVRYADALDTLALITLLRARLDVIERNALDHARDRGKGHKPLPWKQIAQVLGLKSVQAAESHHLRLRSAALLETDGKRTERAARLDRSRTAREAPWLRRNAATLRATAAAVIAHAEDFDDDDFDGDDLAHLDRALFRDPGPGPATADLANRLNTFAGFAKDSARPTNPAAAAALEAAVRLRASHGEEVTNPPPRPRRKTTTSPAATTTAALGVGRS